MDTATVPPSAPVEPASLTDRLTNIVAAPSAAFENLETKPVSAPNWVVPLILSCVISIIYICMAFAQPTIIQGLRAQQNAAISKKVAAGKMTQEQADNAMKGLNKFMTPTLVMIFGSGGAILGSVSGFFLYALLIWVSVLIFTSSKLTYMKVVEVCGLALIIDVPQKIIRIALVAWKGNLLATVSPALFLADPSVSNPRDTLLAAFDLVDIWWLAVLSLGVSKVTGLRYRNAALIVFPIWFVFRIGAALMQTAQS